MNKNVISMEVAISSELKGKDTTQLQELLIDGKSHNITDNSYISDETKRLLEQCVALESLSIVNWRLASLKNFPHLPNLKKLVLSHNSLRDGLQHLLEAKLNLLCLNLTHNLISRVSELLCLGLFENLQTLELVGCSVCKAPDVSATIFNIIPSLKALDVVYISKSEAEDSDPFNTTPHANNNTHHSANNNGINGTQRPPPQHGKLFNMSQLLKDYNETFSLYYNNYSSSNSYGQHEFSTSDLEHLLSDIQPAIPQAPPPPPSPKVREMADTQVPNPPETESTDDEGEAEDDESFDENHDEDLETLQRIAQGVLRQERPTRRAAQPQSRAQYQARQAQMALFEEDDDEDEDDDDFNPDQDSDRAEGSQSSSEEPAQDDRDQREGSDEEGSEEEAPPSPTSHTSGGSSGSKRERDPNADDDAEPTPPKKQC